MSVNRNIFYTALTHIPTILLGVIAGIFITRILGPEGRGLYTLFQSDVELFSLFLSFSFNSVLVYYVANKKIELKRLLGIAVVLIFLSVIILALILVFTRLFFDSSFLFPTDHEAIFYNVYVLIAFALSILNGFINSVFQGKSLFKVINFVSIANSALNLLLFFALYVFYRHNPGLIDIKAVLIITLLVLFLNTGMWLFFYTKHFNTIPSFKFSVNDDLKIILSFVVLSHLGNIINFLNYRIDRWFIEAWKGAEQLGYYSLAVNISEMFLISGRTISSVMFPFFSGGDERQNMKYLGFFSRLNFSLSLLLAVFMFLIADPIVPLVYGEKFSESVFPLKLLIFGVLFSSFSNLFSTYIIANNKVKYNLMAVSVSLVFTIVLDILLIPKYGIIGACIATICSYIAKDLFTFGVFVFSLNGSIKNYFILTTADIRLMLSKIRKNG